ncbi:hypothetical protein L6164_000868 [Bauhinia variegata]|uniref:Uncharacterized protein n=1 Tax=Bauhinia variegata TaxID=167791 RepID=A0ACB9QDW8_BAUVA|nr:hypothetical protein L6164_000868 [Bauhinia variegata]
MEFLNHLSCFSKGIPRKTRKQPSTIIEELCHRFSFADIRSVTNNFKETLIIDQYGFVAVYKGYLNNGTTIVAVKTYKEGSLYGVSEFKNEVQFLCQLHHPNLLPLIGFCIEKKELVLVYEYADMSNGSLHDQLHCNRNNPNVDPLPWKRRLQICIDTARGLHYLHTGAKYAIIHRDINTQHILLSNKWEAKVSGLMWSKRGPLSMSRSLIRVDSRVMGTRGYADPQYVATGILTEKSDVFSFGMVLLEVVTAKMAWECFEKHLKEAFYHNKDSLASIVVEIIDPFLKSNIAPDCWKTFLDVTESCLCENGVERPNMGEVEVELEHALQLQEQADAKMEVQWDFHEKVN